MFEETIQVYRFSKRKFSTHGALGVPNNSHVKTSHPKLMKTKSY